MSLERLNSIDAIGIEDLSGKVVLSLFDPVDWGNVPEHLDALRAKLEAYLTFISGGDLMESYPSAKGRMVVIDVISRYPLTLEGVALIAQARQIATELGVEVRHHLRQ